MQYSTAYDKKHPYLLAQLEELKKYISIIEVAAGKYKFQPSVIVGIMSRESACGLSLRPQGSAGIGDGVPRAKEHPYHNDEGWPTDGFKGFGRGLMQIDYDWHEFARGDRWKNPEQNIFYGCEVLLGCLSAVSHRLVSMSNEWATPWCQSKELLFRIGLAAYNCGTKKSLDAVKEGKDMDFYTSGGDYSQDILSRAGWFQEMGGWA